MPVLLPPVTPPAWPALDAEQRQVLAHRKGALLVRGAAGTGRTTTALTLVADRLTSGELDGDEVLLLAPTRRSAARLRDELSAHVRRTARQPVVRTPSSAAFSILRARAALLGEPPPALISGPEQDLVLADLLAGHQAGDGVGVAWPARVPPAALGLRAFRDELRDLLMRAAERGLRPEDLHALGQRHDRPEWAAAAQVYAEYLDVTRLRSGTPDAGARFDPAVVLDEAAEALVAWEAEVAAPRPRWRLVVVDDYQEATAATARLLHVLADDGASLVLLADPDAAVQTFRGASPQLVDRATLPSGTELGAFGAQELVLSRVWRHGGRLRSVVREVTEEIRGPDRAQRHADAGDPDRTGTAEVALLRSPAQEAAYVAYRLRAAHLHDGVAWGRMAVVVRSGAQVAALRRALLGAQVPVAVLGSDLPLRAEPSVRPLLLALECALRPEALTADAAAQLLTSPLAGLDGVGLRRVRRALRAEELSGGGTRASDPLLVEVLEDPARAQTLPGPARRPVARLAAVLAAGRAAAGEQGAGALDVLWALWSTSGLASVWRRSALAGGPGGARADRDLDAVLALFKAAEQFVDRLPQAPPSAFLEHLQSQDLPADSLAAHGDLGQSVALLTPAGAAGGEWDVVVVAGVQEGTWPDLRLRDSMLGAQQLVDVLAGRDAGASADGATRTAEARAAVLDDELRAFAVAVSRARQRLVVTAVSDADHQPSPLVDLVGPRPEEDGPDPRLVDVPHALDLRAVVARSRAALEAAAPATGPDRTSGPDHPAAALLARLAAAGVPGAHPDQWFGATELSSAAPLWAVDEVVPLSPSRLESAATCTLRWALEAAGGTPGDSGEQSLGTLVHEIAAALPTGTQDELRAALEARWHELGLGEGWVAARSRRRADAMIAHLAAYLKNSGEVLAVEQEFTARLGRVLLRGSVDRLERAGEDADGTPMVRVVDLKTGRSATTAAEARRHPQLGAYQAALDAGAFEVADEEPGRGSDLALAVRDTDGPTGVPHGARSAGASLVYVGTANRSPAVREQVALHHDAEPGWVAGMVEKVADAVSRPAVAATPNDLCRVCPVQRSCPARPEGRVVGA